MKKTMLIIISLNIFAAIAMIAGCKTTGPETPAATNTPPGGPTATWSCSPVTTQATVTMTYTSTTAPTMSPTMSCFKPHIAALYNKMFQLAVPSTNLVILGACKQQSGLVYTAAVYNGSDNLIAVATAIQTACGELRYTIAAPSGNTANVYAWHVAIMEPTATPPAVYNASAPEFYDTDAFFVLMYPPAPTPTAPCSNISSINAGFCDTDLIIEDTFSLSACEKVTFKNDYCSQAFKIAFYDGAGQLKKTEACQCPTPGMSTQTAHYIFDGTETPGTWHVDLFDSADPNVPATRGSGGTYSTCPPNISFVVQ
jgi:hypothetical protein